MENNNNNLNNVSNESVNASHDGFPEISHTHKDTRIVIFIIIVIIAILPIFFLLHAHKPEHTNDQGEESFNVENSPAPLIVDDKTIQPAAKIQPIVNNTPTPIPTSSNNESEDAEKALVARIQAPILASGSQTQTVSNSSLSTNNTTNTNDPSIDPNTKFLNQVSNQDVDTSQTSVLDHLDTLIAQGNLIHATLESAINSDLPGYLRAIVSEPVYSEDGSQVLITPGSRVIGQYKSGMLTGQSRIFIVWTRIIEPNGISIQLGSPGVDSLGIAGVAADKIDYHFWQMFGTATLLSILSAGASNAGVSSDDPYNASQSYREAVSSSLSQSAQNSLQQNTSIPPTLHVNQGAPIMIFVAKDLRFTQAMPTIHKNINVFSYVN